MGMVLKNITKEYKLGTETKKVLDDVSIEIADGELIAICGRSGAGKSTLMHILGLMDSQDKGEYYLDDVNVLKLSDGKKAKFRNEKIGFVLQDFGLVEGESVYNNLRIPLLLGKCRLSRMKKLIYETLESVGMVDHIEKDVSLLSGGEKQRVAIARAIINDPDYILADEPTGSLDSENASIVMDILKDLQSEGRTVIIVTHDNELAKKCDRIIHISDGKCIG